MSNNHGTAEPTKITHGLDFRTMKGDTDPIRTDPIRFALALGCESCRTTGADTCREGRDNTAGCPATLAALAALAKIAHQE